MEYKELEILYNCNNNKNGLLLLLPLLLTATTTMGMHNVGYAETITFWKVVVKIVTWAS